MLVQHDVVVVWIYDHEEDFLEMTSWLKASSQWRWIPEAGGYQFIIDASWYREFQERFNIKDVTDEDLSHHR